MYYDFVCQRLGNYSRHHHNHQLQKQQHNLDFSSSPVLCLPCGQVERACTAAYMGYFHQAALQRAEPDDNDSKCINNPTSPHLSPRSTIPTSPSAAYRTKAIHYSSSCHSLRPPPTFHYLASSLPSQKLHYSRGLNHVRHPTSLRNL